MGDPVSSDIPIMLLERMEPTLHSKYKHARRNATNHTERVGSPKIVDRRYKVTSQTAYHIMEIALQEGITEGRVIDKIIRTYLANRSL